MEFQGGSKEGFEGYIKHQEVFKRVIKRDLEVDSKEDLKVDLEGDSKGDFRGDLKQDLDGDLLSRSGPGQDWSRSGSVYSSNLIL